MRKPSTLLSKVGSAASDSARRAWDGLAPLLRGLLPAVLGPCDLGDFAIHSEWDDEESKLFFYDKAYEGEFAIAPRCETVVSLIRGENVPPSCRSS